MKPSAHCLNIGRKSEGDELTAYQDEGGVWTIGRGHTGPDVHAGLVWTEAQSEAAYEADMAKAAAAVAKLAPNATQCQFDALTDFVFNLGDHALAGSTLLHLHNAGKHTAAAAQFPQWCHDNGVIEPGLVKRRAYETLLYLGEPAL